MGWDPKVVERLQSNVRKPALVLNEVKAIGKKAPRDRGMNSVEKKYASKLELEKMAGRVLFYDFECVKLRIADGCQYIPDFMVMDCDGHISFVDTKAYFKNLGKPGITEDSAVKMKAVAEKFPMFTFLAAWEVEGVWKERVF